MKSGTYALTTVSYLQRFIKWK